MFQQAVTDSAQYKLGYSIGGWLPFVGLAILLTIMILMLRRRRS
jgi:LPXTG-motif cell wall-anchored protein